MIQEQRDKLEEQRRLKRKSGRITFDCFHLKYTKNRRIICEKGANLNTNSLDGTLSETFVLRGGTASTCKACPLFSTEAEQILNTNSK